MRVLIDAAGARYSWPPITHELRRAGVNTARFLPSLAPWRVATINLRNHRKSLVVDGKIAFTGGMNIRHGNVLADKPKGPVQDLHFRVEGPVVAQLQEAFANDWAFSTGEVLDGEIWFPELDGIRQQSSPASSPTVRTRILKSCAGRCSPRWPRRKRPCRFSRRIFCRISRSFPR